MPETSHVEPTMVGRDRFGTGLGLGLWIGSAGKLVARTGLHEAVPVE